VVEGLDRFARHFAGHTGQYIKKHKNDVFRLFAIIDPEFSAKIPPQITDDLAAFFGHMETEDVPLKTLGLQGQTRDGVLAELRRICGID
jgi:hypothetical protein